MGARLKIWAVNKLNGWQIEQTVSYIYTDRSVLFSGTGVRTYVHNTLVVSMTCVSIRKRAVACYDEHMCACVASVAGTYIVFVVCMFSVCLL